MNTDKELLCSEKQAVTADAVSTDSILVSGLLGADRTRNLRCFAQIETGFTPDGSATGMTFEVIEADNGALTTNVVSLYSTGAIANGSSNVNLAAGKRVIDIPLPKLSKPYLGFRYTTNAGDYTTGKVTAGLVIGTETPQADRPVPNSHGF
ncbi:Bbp16 family capsid cement protein [Sphingobium baderi]|uniref:Uncharacterized protein n=1 Tax=Sphingobium baderi LL03 TaxID=1114964 RepID=T0GQM4_9SPHN|nr:hypothetical protein [Sphingobium baderi]EQB06226.1 hypothetical protein L485_00970 [Sphingobium baderi LL03]KMS62733.1 hypothetical protein V475_06450 [Sphingobium baderi LL03]